MKFSVSLILALATSAAAQGFASGCDYDSWKLKDGHVVTAKCNTETFLKTRTTTLDLNKCFVNDDGVLRRRDNGKYANTCRRCQMDPGKPTRLWCQCKNKRKEWKGTSIDLNDHISNNDGTICCKKNCGKKN